MRGTKAPTSKEDARQQMRDCMLAARSRARHMVADHTKHEPAARRVHNCDEGINSTSTHAASSRRSRQP
ncbi:conserved hypothetical protein [Ricinus communis]|uniref:Uncharacterized protein n=1 Tax=Ricinus communis TaxID=3988 RepID=B9S0S5_RICCO|nr:conserved hypothetical protein [Ricinus communis]